MFFYNGIGQVEDAGTVSLWRFDQIRSGTSYGPVTSFSAPGYDSTSCTLRSPALVDHAAYSYGLLWTEDVGILMGAKVEYTLP
jgi:hypothetical protein